jgi:hypothetical protein
VVNIHPHHILIRPYRTGDGAGEEGRCRMVELLTSSNNKLGTNLLRAHTTQQKCIYNALSSL